MSVTRTESGTSMAQARGDRPTGHHLTAVESHDATWAGRRPSTTPAYYHGRPAGLWLNVFGRDRRRSAADGTPTTTRSDPPAADESVAAHRPGQAA
jgi:hypothetical protein